MAGSLTPTQQEALVRLGTWMPFGRAAQMLEARLRVQVSEATVRRHSEQVGQVCQDLEDATSQQAEPEEGEGDKQEKQTLVLSADGAYVPLLHGEWAEVRTLVIGVLAPAATSTTPAKTEQLSYFSRLTDAETFTDLAQGETHRRGVVQASAVCAVTDGADWLQCFIDAAPGPMRRGFLIFPTPPNG